MITNRKNWHRLLWLTSFLVATGAWANLEGYALAQSGGTLTVNAGALVTNPDIVPRAIGTGSDNVGSISLGFPNSLPITSTGSDNVGSISLGFPNSLPVTSGGNISINAGSIFVTPVDSVPSTNGGSITIDAVSILLTPPNSGLGTSGGNIIIKTDNIILRRVPEKSSLLGLLAFAVVGAAYMYKRKQKVM
ncbi:hypothetical protein [Scytonema sp. NUACC26]|uniref:hypothetical protein n=1 Tax=Scytonema sp. NUACC26 TaxID=3140176 RepID=UPI0034DC6D38